MMMGTLFELNRIDREGREAGRSREEIDRQKSEFLDEMYQVHKAIGWGATKGMAGGLATGNPTAMITGMITGAFRGLKKALSDLDK